MSRRSVLRVGPDGILAVHDDDLPVLRLGVQVVRRASHVEFDGDRQEWVAVDTTPETMLLASGSRRDEVVAAEIAVLEHRIRQGTHEFGRLR